MNLRVVSIVGASLICLAGLAGVFAQGRQLVALRAEHDSLRAQRETRDAVSIDSTATAAPVENAARSAASPSLELLRLRAEVTRLMNRRRELFGATNENQRLRVELAARQPNSNQLPAGYIRRSEARMAGYSTPEATLESFLWAVQNRDFTNVLQAFTPEVAKQLEQFGRTQQSTEDFFNQSQVLPGMRIVSRQPGREPDVCELKVEIAPGVPPETMILRQINGQWKMQTQ